MFFLHMTTITLLTVMLLSAGCGQQAKLSGNGRKAKSKAEEPKVLVPITPVAPAPAEPAPGAEPVGEPRSIAGDGADCENGLGCFEPITDVAGPKLPVAPAPASPKPQQADEYVIDTMLHVRKPLTYEMARVNYGAKQRSKFQAVEILFSDGIDVVDGVLTIYGIDAAGAAIRVEELQIRTETIASGKTLATVTGELGDGSYLLKIDGSKIPDLGERDFSPPATDAAGFAFHILWGDLDGSKTVEQADLDLFAPMYGSAALKDLAIADSDADFDVDFSDLAAWRARLGSSVP